MLGKIKWFSSAKGYGFVTPDDFSKECFLHYSNIVSEGFKEVSEGDAVSFDVELTQKGRKATNLRKL